MSNVKRIYVEKKPAYAVKAKELLEEVKNYLQFDITGVRVLIRYDIENISEDTYQNSLRTIFSEAPVDTLYEETFPISEEEKTFSVEYLPGQFDQRADSAEQCVKLLNEEEEPIIRSATTYVIAGDITDEQLDQIKAFCINPVDSRETDEQKPETLVTEFEEPADVKIFDGFSDMEESKLKELYDSLGLAMTFKDFLHIQKYFKEEEKRDPSMTEIRVLDTYWSDHCRHTTFLTELTDVTFDEGHYRIPIEATYERYLKDREELYAGRDDKFVCLMDLALMGMKRLKKDGMLDDMEESDEINACSIVVPVEIDGETEEWLISFKNETHNHPTEIEPFGGAATCLGGAIRDPLSGRSYVYQAMRVTGASDPTVSLQDTLTGKLPQRKIVTGAAHGYSSYGNQIGLATGLVDEIYHPNYVAKRMEIGAVMGAAPRKNVIRETSDPGDIIILLGGRTGRDGCGGATGSSKAHTVESIDTCGAEVQKGNPPTERKIQRLFRREEVSRLIKKCNDFGAGGVSVAIGELADGLRVDLDKVPKKYAGLDGTELAISESQERMAVVVDPKDVNTFLTYAEEENLEAVAVAVVTEDPRLVLQWRGKEIVNLSRAFLDTNGAHQETTANVQLPDRRKEYFGDLQVKNTFRETMLSILGDLNVCSKKGLVEMFDSSIGAGTVTMPYGGKYQMTPIQTMIAKLPVLKGKTDTVTMMSYGFDPYLSSWSPYHGAIYAIVQSVAKIVAAGGDYKSIRFTFQEYFKRLGEDENRWGQPVAALLGAYAAQLGFGLPSIGGKDSMSGTFNDIDVPPTLVSFAVNVAKSQDVITPEFKKPGNKIVRICIPKDEYGLPDYEGAKKVYKRISKLMKQGKIVSAYAVGYGGTIEAVAKMAFGNRYGVKFDNEVCMQDLVEKSYGAIIVELGSHVIKEIGVPALLIGTVYSEPAFVFAGEVVSMTEAVDAWTGRLEGVFPTKTGIEETPLNTPMYREGRIYLAKNKVAKPKVFIPVFPGTNCEYDSLKAFERAGAEVETRIFKNLDAQGIRDSVDEFEKVINQSQIIMFPGGFSAGDEPEGSAKFFATAFRNEKLKEAVMNLLNQRDGLALGICNGFQALIKLGLVPYGEILEQTEAAPTLTMNRIGRHISQMVYTKIVTNKSPWLSETKVGDVHSIAVSHGEGRFVASEEVAQKLFENGQVATQYVDIHGNPTMSEPFNPNGSYYAIEGIISPDGRVLGKMGHSERIGDSVAINIQGNKDQKLFESGVNYFK
ncbi:MAG: phosphoribosylformylglycinamidine synthase [Anaerostipes sp.]|uniref:phosphoribosylformylglycinamidine synthase n=1 Tax=Anaerostipes sp. 992a TaxID=1261637 RepID=UPI0009526E7D|nr:phosphoribosylformylglycinamidine synthase [Anaerostipes sp. 992a]MCI5952404.1 phosphoribosylformylglycinamidine synthase [Anaerostipes sp.]OLR63731.1 phosphoribosylformylglycinamidine synthase [Anaerostipes sp. 992a]